MSVKLVSVLCFLFPLWVNAQLHINEVMTSNDATIVDNVGEYDDWIEIYNNTNAPIDLSDYYISDDPTNLIKWQILDTDPSITTIAPQSYLILWADSDVGQGENHIDFKLSSGGETILLTSPNGTTIIDSLSVPSLGTDKSYGSLTDGQSVYDIITPSTPAASNNGAMPTAEPVVMMPDGGLYSSGQSVTLSSATPGVTIYYTLDGSVPTTASSVYSSPVTVSSTSSIRAIAVKAGHIQSIEQTESFIINFSSTLPIMYVTTDPDNLWDDNQGIYTIGTNGIASYCGQTANYNQDWEVSTHVDLYMPDGTQPIDHNSGMKISGNCMRRVPQKPLNFLFRNEYEPEGKNEVNYKLFNEKKIDKFKRLYLRKGNSTGLPTYSVQYSDPLANLLVEGEFDIETSGVRIVEVFLNDEYWGVYDLREKFDQHRMVREYKWASETDSIDIVRNPGRDFPTRNFWAFERATNGTLTDYHVFEQEFMSKDLTIQSNYEDIVSQMDEDEMMNWLISGVYLGNDDWISNNVKIWKHGKEGIWRWSFVDFDRSMQLAAVSIDVLTSRVYKVWANGNQRVNPLYQKLLANQGFQDEFIQRTATFMNTTFDAARVFPIADSLKNVYKVHNGRAYNRWNGDNSNSYMNSFPETNAGIDGVFQNFDDFFKQRPAHIINHFTNRWGLTGMFTLTVNTNASTNGHVAVNNIYKKLPHNFSGQYFRDRPFKIVAVPDPGYRFSHWLETGVTDAVLFNAYNSNTTLTPVFESAVDLVINEIHYNPVPSDSLEFIEIHNPDTKSKNLEGYQFEDGICMTFPEGAMIGPGEYIIVAKDAAAYANNGYQVFEWEFGSLNDDGEHISLVNSVFTVIDSLTYNDAGAWTGTPDKGYFSLALLDPALDNALAQSWNIQSVLITPGEANDFGVFGVQGPPTLVINEIHYRPADSVSTADGKFISGQKFEFVEVKNVTSGDLDLTGYFFSKGITYEFPAGTMLASGDFIVLAEDKSSFEDRYGFPPFDKYGGKLSDNGELLWITDSATGALIDAVDYSVSYPWNSQANGTSDGFDQSLALIDGTVDNASRLNWSIQCPPTLYTPNQENDYGCFNGYSYDGLLINEIHYNPNGGTPVEFIEIVNTSPNNFYDLQDVSVAGGIFFKFEDQFNILPASTYPQNYIVIANDSAAFHNAYGFAPYGVYQGSLSNTGEQIVLQDLFQNEIDQVTYSSSAPWDTDAAGGAYSLGLIDQGLDNANPINWSNQNVSVTPKTVNTFSSSAYPDYSGIVINEIYYKPPGGAAEEFIEIVNTNPNTPINLEGLYFSDGITYEFENTTVLPGANSYPNNYLVLARSKGRFNTIYGFQPYDNYLGSLHNDGELIKLVDFFGRTVDSVQYDDTQPWDSKADQGQHSLALIDTPLDNAQPQSWATQDVAATPGFINTFDLCQDVIVESNYPDISTDKSANLRLSSNGKISAGNTAVYQAGQCVLLMPEFEVKLGATYTAMIGPCL